jgi:hypothetical protein
MWIGGFLAGEGFMVSPKSLEHNPSARSYKVMVLILLAQLFIVAADPLSRVNAGW